MLAPGILALALVAMLQTVASWFVLGFIGAGILAGPKAFMAGAGSYALLALVLGLLSAGLRGGLLVQVGERFEKRPVSSFPAAVLSGLTRALGFFVLSAVVDAVVSLACTLLGVLGTLELFQALGHHGVGVLAAFGQALGFTLTFALWVGMELVLPAGFARAVVLRSGALVALHDATAAVGRRFFSYFVVVVVPAVLGLGVSMMLSASRGNPGAPLQKLVPILVGMTILAAAFSGLTSALAQTWRMSALAALALNDVGTLEATPRRVAPPPRAVLVAAPVPEPILEAKPVPPAGS